MEWKVVFVVGMDQGIFPSLKASYDLLGAMQEERRLAYVATTRAMERLFVTHTQSRFLYGSRQYCPPSEFYGDIVGEPQRTQRYDEDGVPMYDNLYTTQTVSVAPTIKVNDVKITAGLKSGQKVMHKTYGEGMIINVQNGNADVVFPSVGKKTLNLKYAPITPIDYKINKK